VHLSRRAAHQRGDGRQPVPGHRHAGGRPGAPCGRGRLRRAPPRNRLCARHGIAQLYADVAHPRVTSIHHLSVKALGSGLAVEARSPEDGVIEAIRWTGGSYVLGLQWHPEFHPEAGSELLDGERILLEFLQAARERRMGAAARP
jgi:hypothetical protein